jgi:hypothetical protein
VPSELQRVAQQLLATLDEIPRVVAYLHDRASKYRESAGWIGSISNNPSARMAAMQLDEAARRCEEAAHYLSMAPPKARSWVEQMVSGARAAEPVGGSGGRRPGGPGGSPPPGERRQNEDQAEPEAKKVGKTAGADDEASPADRPALPRISDEEGWRLFGKLPNRQASPVSRPKTRGIWKDADGNEHDLASGQRSGDGEGDDPYYQRVVDFMREHRIGRQDADPMVASHVESKFALFMREHGLLHETIAVNKVPCDGDFGCDTLLDRFLPPGGTLTVFGPGGFKKTYPKPE